MCQALPMGVRVLEFLYQTKQIGARIIKIRSERDYCITASIRSYQ
jgi:hypothetical protein